MVTGSIGRIRRRRIISEARIKQGLCSRCGLRSKLRKYVLCKKCKREAEARNKIYRGKTKGKKFKRNNLQP